MHHRFSTGFRLAVVSGATFASALLAWAAHRVLPESSPVARGAAFVQASNCIECHGLDGDQSFDDAAFDCAGPGNGFTHELHTELCRDLLAYFEVVRLKRTFDQRATASGPNRLLQGERLARKYSCFQCHGELGQGGFRNEGALKGYVPGYFGDDFASLTRGGRRDSVLAWIRHGRDSALFDPFITGKVARFFIERQSVGMPSYGTLPEVELEILADYVIALNRLGKMGATEISEYGRQTQRLSTLVMDGAAY